MLPPRILVRFRNSDMMMKIMGQEDINKRMMKNETER